jgi:heme/copper-type cytochrome/quinol oxidase subunit 2
LLLCAVVVVVVVFVVVVVVSPFFLFRWRPRNDCEQSKVNHPNKPKAFAQFLFLLFRFSSRQRPV